MSYKLSPTAFWWWVMNVEELSRIMGVNEKAILSKTVAGLNRSEYDVMVHELNQALKIPLGEREITLKGLERNKNIVLKTLAEFKDKEKRNVMPYQLARADDITAIFGVLRPELFGLDNFRQTNLAVGTVDIIPQGAGTFSVPEKQVFVITDFIEFEPNPVVTAIMFTDVDGALPKRPLETRTAFRASDIQIFSLPYVEIAQSTLDIDGKVEFTGDTEIVPCGAWIGYGKDVPDIT